MISQKLKNIFGFSIILFIAHGIEEIFTGFYNTDLHSLFVFSYLNSLSTSQAVFILFQIMVGLTFIVSYLLILGSKWQLRLMFIIGVIFVYEFHHLYAAIGVEGYYPGLVTAISLYIVGFFYWKELIRNYKR